MNLHHISEFRILEDITEREIQLHGGKIKVGFSGVWLRSDVPFHYNLYEFKTNDFFQGILKICTMLNVDFRIYMLGFPFNFYGEQYFNTKVKELAIYTPDRQYEIFQEDRDDENTIELLTKDFYT